MTDIQRDRWGRPLVLPPGGGKAVPYTRVSTMAKTLDDQSNLVAWKQRMTAAGLALSPNLLDRVYSILNRYDNPVKDGRREFNTLVEDAVSAAGGDRAAETGTALHELTEQLDEHGKLAHVPPRFKAHLDAYVRAHAEHNLLPLAQEVFVVNDELQAAGTFDRLYDHEGRIRVGDLKSGSSDPDFPLKVAIQIAVYAHGAEYDPATGKRSEIHPDLDLDTGILVHMPSSEPAETAYCNIYELDLKVGYEAALMASSVFRVRKIKAKEICKLVDRRVASASS